MVDLSSSMARELLAEKIKAEIDEYCRVTYDDGPRTHLGASLLAHPCAMYKWLVFRWACEERFDGRMQRLFNRGHREEARFIEWLRGTGWTVREHEPQTDTEIATGAKPKQIRISFSEKHGGGSLDAELEHREYEGQTFLGEFKTFNEKSFAKLIDRKKGGVQLAKPQHWGQMCSYGFARKIRYSIYFAICKNDDALHIEVHELNWKLGEDLMREGEQIIVSPTPPPRLSENPQWRDCLYCGKHRVCHGGEAVDRNCRSCRHAFPQINGEWRCGLFEQTIPPDFIPHGCDKHFSIMA